MRTTTTSPAVQTVGVCDECAGEGQMAYDMQARMWVPRSATADWPADERMAIGVLDCLQCEGTGTMRLKAAAHNHPRNLGR